jgi:hypothetical protein
MAAIVDAAPVVVEVDAPPPVAADLQCYANGPKEYIQIRTDVATMTGTLRRLTTGPVPDRVIQYRAVADGPAAFDLVFVEYGPGDYQRMGNRKPATPREKLKPGESVIARVQVVGRRSRIFSRDVDLHTGMTVQEPDHSYPCNLSVQGGVIRSIP